MQKYDLSWKTYSDHLKEMLHEMMKSEDLTDVTLVCDDKKQLKAHKVVLSACSSVFKSIIGNLPLNNSVIYLRGVQHQEMESILEFMYLGVATFYQERMNEFLNVAKSLEVKEISNQIEFGLREDETSVYDDLNTKNVTKLDTDNQNEDVNEDIENIDRNEKSENVTKLHTDNQIEDVNVDEDIKNIDRKGKSENVTKLDMDNQNEDVYVHEDIQHIDRNEKSENVPKSKKCYECDELFVNSLTLMRHHNSIHKGVLKFQCGSCDKEYFRRQDLKMHVKSYHEGVKFPCNQCDKQFGHRRLLKVHVKSYHEGVKFQCDQCDKQYGQRCVLNRHFRLHHR